MHEVNHPMWAKAIELMYPKANQMSKPRYWNISYPCAVTMLCVAPHDYFLRNWIPFVEMSTTKLKVIRLPTCFFRFADTLIAGSVTSGKVSSPSGSQRHSAYRLDIPLPVSRTCIIHDDEARYSPKALLPLKVACHLPFRRRSRQSRMHPTLHPISTSGIWT